MAKVKSKQNATQNIYFFLFLFHMLQSIYKYIFQTHHHLQGEMGNIMRIVRNTLQIKMLHIDLPQLGVGGNEVP